MFCVTLPYALTEIKHGPFPKILSQVVDNVGYCPESTELAAQLYWQEQLCYDLFSVERDVRP